MISGLPIERVHVSLRRFANGGWDRYGAQTTAEGKFTISAIPAGNYQTTLTVSATSFRSRSRAEA